jgi:hypothetical protein
MLWRPEKMACGAQSGAVQAFGTAGRLRAGPTLHARCFFSLLFSLSLTFQQAPAGYEVGCGTGQDGKEDEGGPHF